MSFDNAYEGLNEEHGDDARWAYGTGFADELSGVDRALPSTVDKADLAAYAVMLGDDALVLAQRTSEWCSRAPELEEDVALANIALDLLGQARLLLTRAGEAGERPSEAPSHVPDEDALAYFRTADQFRNVRMVELANGDFADTIARLLLFSCQRLALFTRLSASADPVLAAVAAKGAKELAYHRDHAARWVVRLGDGTEESRGRMIAALDRVWPYLDELFTPHPIELRLAAQGVAVDPAELRTEVDGVLDQVFTAATLTRPASTTASGGGRYGSHTGVLAELLAEMQVLARALPEATW
ncbi:1,2-phenylacetyl-CoA epoxidase subunit PaaC [Allokutzneria albata]|uniref:Ring-1,2-phenylacetyl-CoA epoxidase subunit PaaC n=1 Tax=Allokutzneria albata TaxID=211114 RepID=A0A1G9VIB7_ALLAB|nr:1,2-phenylacetyl-CoA epoxidase subunit PaaC [Allokutzneria albata]SDM71823.1 ring-1,2-phenylacetyl-CoA epoxidase subunit PaaC [Allokutzneria albata]